ncbi:MAG: type VI secretion system tip protein TssI/VgrG, partial [Planctomycetota bacterium]|nr:type VI secretion system tip protein TssI/VgrG [Planctomycetota bacterium]
MPEEHSVEVKWSGRDEFKLKALIAQESMGRPFWTELRLLCEKPDIKFDDVVGKTMAVKYTDAKKNTTSFFHGYVADFVLSEADNETKTKEMKLYGYRATLVPWNWLLTRSQDCKIFQSKSIPDIIKQVSKDRGFTDIDDKLTGSYKNLDYTVQYRESDFNFISRLMEQEGIYYFYEQKENKHDLVLVDASTGHNKSGAPSLIFRGLDSSRTEEEDSVRDWLVHHKLQSVEYHLTDFDFEKPTADLLSKSKITQKHEQNKAIVFDYPGKFIVTKDGENYAKINIQRLQSRHEIVSGRSVVQAVRAGQVITLKEHPRADQNRDYLVIESRIRINPEMYGSGEAAGAGQRGSNTYECEFKAIDLQVPYRPERITPRPVVHGPQTAVVVGKKGEEIWTDKYGRIKVQFHWDREGKKDENSSCWIRVAQIGAGTQWGMIHIPRMGQEVMVEFLEGDPDRPIVTGVVYNADRMPPYTLPDNMTQTGLKTR